jgi:hypothetical protein
LLLGLFTEALDFRLGCRSRLELLLEFECCEALLLGLVCLALFFRRLLRLENREPLLLGLVCRAAFLPLLLPLSLDVPAPP